MFSNEEITHLKRIALNLNFQFYIKTKSNIMLTE